MERIEATYRVVTPMFMSGADQQQAELRLPSIKGALRFWWRALAWGRHGGNLEAIRNEENKLFGSTDTGQAAVLMKLEILEFAEPSTKSFDVRRYPGLVYLGYGVMDFNGNVVTRDRKRPYLPNGMFRLHLAFKSSLSIHAKNTVTQAIKILGLLGNVGSKARKGYGSLVLAELKHNDTPWQAPQNIDELRQQLKSFKSNGSIPSYTALSARTRFLLVEGSANESALSLLSRIGGELVFYRSWGNYNQHSNRHEVLNRQPAEQNFVDDHDLMKGIASGRITSSSNLQHPERIVFGLPHNYYFGSLKAKADVKAVDYKQPNKPTVIDRRASPLFIHVHQIGETPVAVITFLPSQFLPESAKICLAGASQKDVDVDAPEYLWQPINDFLERLKGTNQQPPFKRRESFTRVVEV